MKIEDNEDSIKIFFNLNYWGETAEWMVKSWSGNYTKLLNEKLLSFSRTKKLQKMHFLQIQKIEYQP